MPRLIGSSRPLNFEELGNQIVNEIVPDSINLDIYFRQSDIFVSKDDSPAAIRAYDEETDKILLAAFRGLQKHPLVIFSEALQTDNLAGVAELDPYLKAYDEVIAKAKKLYAPSLISSLHLRSLNNLAAQKDAVRKMRSAETDVLKAVVGVREFINAASSMNTLFKEFQDTLASAR